MLIAAVNVNLALLFEMQDLSATDEIRRLVADDSVGLTAGDLLSTDYSEIYIYVFFLHRFITRKYGL